MNAPGVSETGLYHVVLVPPASMHQVSRKPSSILISRGGINASGVNFVVANMASRAQAATPAKVRSGRTLDLPATSDQ